MALEDGETVLISKPERFREYGVALIRDEQEGCAREETVTLEPETPEEAAKRRATSDLNDALQLVGSGIKSVHRVEYNRRKTQSESFSHGKDWWIFCASIKPDEAEWDAWRASLDEDYGHVLSSDIKRRESVEERVATKDLETDDRGILELRRAEEREDAGSEHPALEIEQESGAAGDADDEDAVAKEVALDERDWNDEHGRDEFVIPVVHRGSGCTFKSFGEMLEDPTAPTGRFAKTWEVSACSPEEIVKSYGAVATLALKVTRVAVEHRKETASACWHALQCINHIYARPSGKPRAVQTSKSVRS